MFLRAPTPRRRAGGGRGARLASPLGAADRGSDVIASFDSADASTIYIDIRYSVGETNDPEPGLPLLRHPAEST